MKGLRCPNGACPYPRGLFTVHASVVLVMDSDGDIVDQEPEYAYDDDTCCTCGSCFFSGSLIDFRAKYEDYITYPRPKLPKEVPE